MNSSTKQNLAKRRAHRTRARLHGTSERPRLTVNRSLKHVYAQLIDDDKGVTIVSASDKDIAAKGKPIEVAKAVGTLIAEKAKTAGLNTAIFDRGSYRYHGRVAAIAEGAREAGLKI
jgi:large subunit ribosomal protein L18